MKERRSEQLDNAAKSVGGLVGSAGQRAGAAQRPFAVFDIDGTLIRWQLYHAIADAFLKLGFAEEQAYDSVKSARMLWKKREPQASFKTYEAELIKVYEKVLRSLNLKQFEQAAQDVFEEYKDQVYIYTRGLIKDLKARGYLLFAISGSQVEVVELMAGYYCFDDYVGTVYKHDGQRFSGEFIFHAAHKDKALKELIAKHNASYAGSVAVGDSKSDAAMMKLVEKPIAFNPDADLYQTAAANGWKIVLERKNMVYELESKYGTYRLVKTNAG